MRRGPRPDPDPLWAVYLVPRRLGGRMAALADPGSGRRTTSVLRHVALFRSPAEAYSAAGLVDDRTRRGRRVLVERL